VPAGCGGASAPTRASESIMAKRVILIVMDGVGCGEMPDADAFGDSGSNTIGNVAQHFPDGLDLPNMGELGLGNIISIRGVPRVSKPAGAFGKAAEAGPAKDTTLGHWEIAGVIADQAFPTYPDGFPDEVIDAFVEQTGVPGILCNKPASGTEVIAALGEEHVETGKPIVYTSGDSVFQIACHEEIYPPEKLYEQCRIARAILDGEHRVGRVIARPFEGKPGAFKRTSRRRDFSVEPIAPTICDELIARGFQVQGVGKISDIFAARGISRSTKTVSNTDGMEATLKVLADFEGDGLLFVNLVDTDMLFGHRNDPEGFKGALEEIDRWIPSLIEQLGPDDLAIFTADHGIDPTTASTDHSREYVPILAAGPRVAAGVDLGTRETFADIAATIDAYFELGAVKAGRSFLPELLNGAHA
jgi:phosphopentomutase